VKNLAPLREFFNIGAKIDSGVEDRQMKEGCNSTEVFEPSGDALDFQNAQGAFV